MRYAGGFSLPVYDKITTDQINGIKRKYGIISERTCCIINPIDTKAKERYSELTEPFPVKRNGKGWKEKMKKEIGSLKKR